MNWYGEPILRGLPIDMGDCKNGTSNIDYTSNGYIICSVIILGFIL